MRPELSNIVRFESAGGAAAGSRAPVIDTRTTELIISMPLGKTLVLGGLQNLQRREIANKVPFFGDLPLVGPALFSSKAKIAENRNLVLVVEPQLVDYNNIPEFDAANQHEQKHYKWKKEYGSASLQNVDSTIQEWGFGVGEGVKHGKNPVAPYAKPVNQKP
jgi:type II secretory pathway component GspD/PulD (secretin)